MQHLIKVLNTGAKGTEWEPVQRSSAKTISHPQRATRASSDLAELRLCLEPNGDCHWRMKTCLENSTREMVRTVRNTKIPPVGLR